VSDVHDVVVVGGGAAGCVVAARLAEAGRSVCLVEAGPSDEGDPRILEIGRWASLAGSELVRSFPVEPQVRGNSALLHSRAYVLGGCASHNQAIALVPPAADLEAWERLGATGWGPAGTARCYERVLERLGVQEAAHGNACAAAFVEAGRQAGLPEASFGDPEKAEGVGWLPLNARRGLRRSSAVAYLHPLAAAPPGLTVLLETAALRVLLDGNGDAVGVETTRGPIRALQEVVLCAGALETPKLLMLSGIGPAGHLRELGIPVVRDLPGVGARFLDHPEATLVWESSRPVPTGVVQDWETAAIARTDPSLELPDVMIHFGTMPAREEWLPPGTRGAEHALWMTPNVMRPRSSGTLRLRSADPADAPRLDPRYYTDADGYDERTMVAGAELARRIAAQPALAEWISREIVPGPAVRSATDLSEYARRRGTTVHHPAGTCRLGAADDSDAVVDPELRVRGVGRLRVADASVFPEMVGVNINITCMMVGEKCAELVLGREEVP
jgi:choline dehydrogenase-like flavoprotein